MGANGLEAMSAAMEAAEEFRGAAVTAWDQSAQLAQRGDERGADVFGDIAAAAEMMADAYAKAALYFSGSQDRGDT